MYVEMFSKNILAIFLLGFSVFSWAGDAATSNGPAIYSSWTVYPASGDCGGFTVTLLEAVGAVGVKGFFQAYEGNCEDEKTPIKILKFDRRTGEFSFSAPSYVQDGKGGLEVASEWKFSGRIEKNGIVGKIQSCRIDGSFCAAVEKIHLFKTKFETK